MTIQTDVKDADHREAIGRTEVRTGTVLAEHVAALAATLDLPAPLAPGSTLPPGWHWIFFNPFPRRSDLGPDGHMKRGGFLPDVALPRRMWAGGKLTYHAPVPIGAQAEKESRIVDVTSKSGRTGELVFVTVQHRVSVNGTLCIEEKQDIVYREPADPAAPKAAPAPAPTGAVWSEEFSPDPALLFRYSALTSNGHRIHYDQPYATGIEGYPGLVVHGPLIATLLQGLAARCRDGYRMTGFSFRGMSPLFVDRPFRLEAAPDAAPDTVSLWARGSEGELAMKAEATFAR